MYTVDQKIIEVLKTKSFTVSAEIIPPRNGEAQRDVFEKISKLIGAQVDFLSVTKGAGGSLRGGSLPIAQAIKDHFSCPSIAHFTCRDLVPEEIENSLMDHHYFGIRNILALRGDPPMGVESWVSREGGYSFAYQLVDQIRALNEGEFLSRANFKVDRKEKTDFCIGVAVYPEHPDEQERILFSQEKFRRGADYGITQMLFDPDVYARYLDLLATQGIYKPILPGLRILKSKKQAQVMKQRFGCATPEWYFQNLPDDDKPLNGPSVLEPFLKIVENLKRVGAPGVHLFILSDTDLNIEAITQLNSWR